MLISLYNVCHIWKVVSLTLNWKFQVGVQHKTAEVRSKSSNLIRVNVYKDKVCFAI